MVRVDWIYECKCKGNATIKYVQTSVDLESLWGVTPSPHNDKLFRLLFGEYGSQLWSFCC